MDNLGISQKFDFAGNKVRRSLDISGTEYTAFLPRLRGIEDPEKNYFVSYLGSERETYIAPSSRRVTYIDLFSGGGGLSLGVNQSFNLFGFKPKCLAAVDMDAAVGFT